MKVCKYCGEECNESKKTCSSCGSNEFNHKCENCGTVFDSAFCPNCGVKVGQKPRVCPKCNSKYYTNACPNCGLLSANNQASTDNTNIVDGLFKNNSSCLTVLLWIMFFPIMLLILIWRSEKLNSKTKIIFSAIIGVFFLITLIIAAFQNESSIKPSTIVEQLPMLKLK